MDCSREIYSIQVSSYGATSNVSFVGTLNTPVKNIVKAELVTTSLSCSSSNIAYVVVDELVTRFNDYAVAQPADNDSASHNLNSTSSVLRNTFGSVYNDDHTVKNRITYYNRYPITADFFNPINELSKLTIKLYDHTGTLLTDEGFNFLTFRFTCLHHNLC